MQFLVFLSSMLCCVFFSCNPFENLFYRIFFVSCKKMNKEKEEKPLLILCCIILRVCAIAFSWIIFFLLLFLRCNICVQLQVCASLFRQLQSRSVLWFCACTSFFFSYILSKVIMKIIIIQQRTEQKNY